MWTKIFPKNEGTVDRVIRIVLGLGLLAIAFFGPKTPLGYIGVIPLLTGLIGSCPLYRLVGLRTCPVDAKA
ncbi:MAG: DUF2892 domain-containing protein [Polyangiaceae bacterium]|nr:DUF2892 domain-containing protein [Polyangiaceae bacterium]